MSEHAAEHLRRVHSVQVTLGQTLERRRLSFSALGKLSSGGSRKESGKRWGSTRLQRILGVQAHISVYADASAATGICHRSGIGRIRHSAVGQLWVQERFKVGALPLCEHIGQSNPAGPLTRSCARLLGLSQCRARCRAGGRARQQRPLGERGDRQDTRYGVACLHRLVCVFLA